MHAHRRHRLFHLRRLHSRRHRFHRLCLLRFLTHLQCLPVQAHWLPALLRWPPRLPRPRRPWLGQSSLPWCRARAQLLPALQLVPLLAPLQVARLAVRPVALQAVARAVARAERRVAA